MRLKSLSTALLAFATSTQAADFDINNYSYDLYSGDDQQSYSLNIETNVNPFYLSLNDNIETEPKLEAPLPLYLQVQPERDWNYLKEQTYTILGLSVATVGLMTLLPESITKWDAEARDMSKLGKKWSDNVSQGPVWDRDEHFLNYIMHPYFGGVYYTASRHAGFNEFESYLYSMTMSTLFWEFGVEAFAEIPSWQDIFITPFFGAVVGELMFEGEQKIAHNGGEVLGSETLGDVSLFFLNPVGHIHYWVTDAWGGDAKFNFRTQPWTGYQTEVDMAVNPQGPLDKQFYGMELTLTF
ncbi:DUF3943 domain-containing protein [Vibrio penaeicida]|nr:DUF3943 domain-containing protein [Vibrio penaeicida]MDP2570622.1 DUF3943 domain-containing protein [Vibrio penaeicida]